MVIQHQINYLLPNFSMEHQKTINSTGVINSFITTIDEKLHFKAIISLLLLDDLLEGSETQKSAAKINQFDAARHS